jgi:hypothetical protein
MKVVKEILVCTTPFMVASMMLYPFMAIVGGSTDPFMWERTDRMFYFVCTVAFGLMLLSRVQYVSKWSNDGSH